MEPEAHANFSGPEEPHKVALVSIAISLKRIADALNYEAAGTASIYDFLSRISERMER